MCLCFCLDEQTCTHLSKRGRFVLFCFVLFCFVLFRFVSFCFVSFRFVLFCFVLFCFVLFCFVSFRFVLSRSDSSTTNSSQSQSRNSHTYTTPVPTYLPPGCKDIAPCSLRAWSFQHLKPESTFSQTLCTSTCRPVEHRPLSYHRGCRKCRTLRQSQHGLHVLPGTSLVSSSPSERPAE